MHPGGNDMYPVNSSAGPPVPSQSSWAPTASSTGAVQQRSAPATSLSHSSTQPSLLMRTRISPSSIAIVSGSSNQESQQLVSPEQVRECYVALLGMAEYFRKSSPPSIRLAIHCLKAALCYKLPVNYEARTHLQLGKLLFMYSKNDDLIKQHLEKARVLGAHLRAPDDLIKFEAADLLADFFERKGKRYDATCILNDTMRFSPDNPYWHCRLLLKRAQACVADKDINSACELLASGSEFAQSRKSEYTRGLFLLSKCMLLLASRQLPEVTNTLTVANRLIENLNGTVYQREALRLFYLIIYVSLFLLAGRAKSAHPILRQLQQSIRLFASMEEMNVASTQEVDRFQWMPREYIIILIYLITVMLNMQSGSLQRAQHAADKAFMRIENLSDFDTNPLLTVFKLSLLEHTIMCRLVMGDKTKAVEGVGLACKLCYATPALMHRRRPQLHTLIGLYAMSMNCMNQAEEQFKLALRYIAASQAGLSARVPGTGPASTSSTSTSLTHPSTVGVGESRSTESVVAGGVGTGSVSGEGEGGSAAATDFASTLSGGPRDSLSVLICLNLALVYIRKGDIKACEMIVKEVFTSGLQVLEGCYCLRAAADYVRGFQAFIEGHLQDAKANLRETVRLSHEEELNRLSTSAYITLGQINLNERNIRDAHDLITKAIIVAKKLPDIGIQLWATALLKDLANIRGVADEERHWFAEHDQFSKMVINDHMQANCSPEHSLINWFDGPLPSWLTEQPTSTTAL
ncbi:MAU2 chromatid cohesion factor -like protein [Echinococcus granulosus]|nr:MAU2 chromatid cohesion factor -like protein [Echinococcus granulosus]CDS22649.1 mau2 chromatid cohesion factor [Echinococcus granulosus]